MLQTRFTELLKIEAPVQLAGMPGVCTVELAAAVANAGGLGILSAAHLSPGYLSDELDQLCNRSQGAYAVNFLVPFLELDCVKVAASKARVVEFFYGDPDRMLVETVHAGGALASGQVGAVDEAVKASQAGCDFVVAQGVQAGGHVRGDVRLEDLLPDVVRAVDVPVLAAGGIGTGKDLAKAINAGAHGVRVGTRFVAATESGAHPGYVAAIIAAGEDSTVLTETFSAEWPHAHYRVLKSRVEAAAKHDGNVVGERELGGEKTAIRRYSIVLPTRNTSGDIDAMALYAGESTLAVGKVQDAADIVREMTTDASFILSERRKPFRCRPLSERWKLQTRSSGPCLSIARFGENNWPRLRNGYRNMRDGFHGLRTRSGPSGNAPYAKPSPLPKPDLPGTPIA
jgi:nitronate monooxygenase